MKSTILHLLLAISMSVTTSAKVIFVKQDGNGDGTSWAKAFGSLQQALSAASFGSDIWVAEGTYLPTECAICSPVERQISFHVPGGVKLYGGFNGTESGLGQRKWYAHPTKLSGEIGTESETDNSYTVVAFKNADAGTLLDGFVITGGFADGWGTPGSPQRAGGAIYNDGSGKGGRSTVELQNCVFLENYAEEGGAIFNHGYMGEAVVELANCTFVSNHAGKGGGAIFTNNDLGLGKIELKKCKFVKNEAAFGGAVFITQKDGAGKNQIVSTNFVANKATAGSGMFSLALNQAFEPDFFLCDYLNNESKEGEELFFCPDSTVPQRLLNALAVNVSEKL
ncbi:MAG: hypothetical protein IT258_16560 [Saprospiraceae bacterium]|nr:hypothetical protein [Saprospiraceae bacterium]